MSKPVSGAKRMSKTQREVLEALRDTGQRIVYFPPTDSVWLYAGPMLDRKRFRYSTFAVLFENSYVEHVDQCGTDHFYAITPAGRAALKENHD